MLQQIVPVTYREEIAEGMVVLRFESREIASAAGPGQFVNVRSGDACLPLLRRPFSISRLVDGHVELLFTVIGQGTRLLAAKRPGDSIDVLGPLGLPFRSQGDYDTAVIVAGGVGVAPFPFLTAELKKIGKAVVTFLGARVATQLVPGHLENIHLATDDGSRGFHGTVVDLLRADLDTHKLGNCKIFACGPTAMLRAVSALAGEKGLECELSLEGEMACGIGLCQGCPVERTSGKKKYALVCTDGPSFNSKDIVLS